MEKEYLEALMDIARALRKVPPGKPVAFVLELLPEQVDRRFADLEAQVRGSTLRAERAEAQVRVLKERSEVNRG